MLVPSLLAVVGLVLLAVAADHLVLGASRLATRLRLSPVVVGVVVIGLGTSAPEFLVSGVAAARGDMGIAVGNIVGSNILNVTLILGVAALVGAIGVVVHRHPSRGTPQRHRGGCLRVAGMDRAVGAGWYRPRGGRGRRGRSLGGAGFRRTCAIAAITPSMNHIVGSAVQAIGFPLDNNQMQELGEPLLRSLPLAEYPDLDRPYPPPSGSVTPRRLLIASIRAAHVRVTVRGVSG